MKPKPKHVMRVTRISTGNLRRYLVGCGCGRGFELDTVPPAVPEHTCNPQKESACGS